MRNYWLDKNDNDSFLCQRLKRYKKYENLRNDPQVQEMLTEGVNHICGNSFTIESEKHQEDVKFTFKWLKIKRKLPFWVGEMLLYGDNFIELITSSDNYGVLMTQEINPHTMYRIETITGKLVEFQQSAQGPDYHALVREFAGKPIESARAVRFKPSKIIHMRLGTNRRIQPGKPFYPYGKSILEEPVAVEKAKYCVEKSLQDIALRHLELRGHDVSLNTVKIKL
jgi:hypothetical protein